MKTKETSQNKAILRTAIVRPYEFVSIFVYCYFLFVSFREELSIFVTIILLIIGLYFIFLGVKRLLDRKAKIIIDSSGINLTDEGLMIEWCDISNVEIGQKIIKRTFSKKAYDSTVGVNCLFIETKGKKVEKIIDRLHCRNKSLRQIIKFYMDQKK